MSAVLTGSATAAAVAAAVRSKQVTAIQVTEAALARIVASNPVVNAFTTVTSERARAEAAAIDAVVSAGRDPGPLAGVPYAVKNLFDLEGVVTVAGSKLLATSPPASADAFAVNRLREAGAVCVGALNMGEFAYDFVTENAHAGSTRNPRDPGRSAGGSSGGSAAAVAAGVVPIALGTDTNGSIRVPASFCGVWGLKPTFGRLSRAGAFPFVASLDHIGPFTRSVTDLALAYDTLQGSDVADPVCSGRPPAPTLPHLAAGIDGLRIGILDGYFATADDQSLNVALEQVAAALGATRRIEWPDVHHARAAAFVITATEGGRLHLERLKTQANEFDPAVRDRLLAGAMMPAAWYLQAQRFRRWWRTQVLRVMDDFDVLLAPATPVPATRLGQEMMTVGGRELLVRPNLGVFTQPVSFIGLPVVAAPVTTDPLPVAVQLIGAPWSEAALLRVANHLERVGACAAPMASALQSEC